jgi:WD40 repeat protein
MLVLEGHTDRVRGLAYSPDGRLLASCGNDTSIVLWDAAAGKELTRFHGPRRIVYRVAFSPDGETLASAGADKNVRLWNVRDGGQTATLGRHDSVVVDASFSADGQWLVAAAGNRTGVPTSARQPNGEVALWRVNRGYRFASVGVDYTGVWSAAFSPDRKSIVVGTGHKALFLWRKERWWADRLRWPEDFLGETPTSINLRANAWGLAYSPDGDTLAATAGWSIKLLDARRGYRARPLKGHRNTVSAIAYAPDGRRIVSGSYDRTVRVWDASTGRQRAEFAWGIGKIDSVAVSPDGMTAAAGGAGQIVVWDLEP